MLKKLKKNALLIVLVIISIGAYQPSLNPVPELDPYFQQLNTLIFSNDASIIPSNIDTSWLIDAKDKVLGLTHSVEIPSELSGLPEDIVVDDAINLVASEVKKLPEKQIQKIKVNICEQILAESTGSGINTQ